MIINTWRNAKKGEFNHRSFLPVCPKDTETMWREIQQYAARVKNPGLSDLLKSVFDEHAHKFTMAPAAVYHHHPYLSGLMEHTLGVLNCLPTDKSVFDDDTLICGALMHDIAKVEEIDYLTGCTIKTTDRGKLLGHISMGIMIINEHAKNCRNLSQEKLEHIIHIVESHHGKLEWGSPVEPLTPEAMAIHYADMLDCQIWKYQHAAKNPKGNWTEKIPGLNRRCYIPQK